MAKPNRAYVTARSAQITARQGLSETRIPAHLRSTPEQAMYLGIRHGKVKNKPASELWSTVSPYYKTSATIDKRYDARGSEGQPS